MATRAVQRWFGLGVCGLAVSSFGCGGVDGARYTIDGVATFAQAGGPDSTITLALSGYWSDDESFEFTPLGGDSSETFTVPAFVIDSWASTADPYRYSFSETVDVPKPEEGEEPMGASVALYRSSDGASSWGMVSAHEVGDEEDGWIPVHVAATFDFGSTW